MAKFYSILTSGNTQSDMPVKSAMKIMLIRERLSKKQKPKVSKPLDQKQKYKLKDQD